MQEISDSFVESDYSDNLSKDSRDIKKALKIEQDCSGVYIIAVVSNVNSDEDDLLEIPARVGDPLTYEAHDIVRDVFHVNGIAYHEIGRIPVNYRISIEDVPWQIDLPLPLTVIRRYMTDEQKHLFDKWKAEFVGKDYSFEFIQILDVF